MTVPDPREDLAFFGTFKGLLRVEGVEGEILTCLGDLGEVGREMSDVRCAEGGNVEGAGGVNMFEDPVAGGSCICCPLMRIS